MTFRDRARPALSIARGGGGGGGGLAIVYSRVGYCLS